MSDHPESAQLFQLDRSTCMALLTTQRVGRLVVATDEPRVVPVNYAVVDGSIVFRSDQDDERVRQIIHRAVVFEIDGVDERTRSGWSVVVHGPATVMTEEQVERAGDRLECWAPGPKDVWFMISIGDVTGRLLRGAVTPTPDDHHSYL